MSSVRRPRKRNKSIKRLRDRRAKPRRQAWTSLGNTPGVRARAGDELAHALDYRFPLEPAATAQALAERAEGEHLYQKVKRMELEALQHPEPEDLLVQIAQVRGLDEVRG